MLDPGEKKKQIRKICHVFGIRVDELVGE